MLTSLPIRFLTASSVRGSSLLAVGIFGGLLIPPLAHALRGFIAPTVVCMMTLVLLRVDVAATFGHLRRPDRLAVIVALHMLASPLIAWLIAAHLGLEPTVVSGVVVFATGCAATSSAAFARLVGLDPELSLIASLATTLIVPLTGPPIALALAGVDLAITWQGLMARLALIVLLPLAISLLIRRMAGRARLEPFGPAVDGALVWLVVLYGFAVVDGLVPMLQTDPAWGAQAFAAAFAVNFGLNALTTLALAAGGLTRRAAATAGLMSGNRNMALYLAVLPAAANPRIAMFLVICQFPLFLSPFLLRPLYRVLA